MLTHTHVRDMCDCYCMPKRKRSSKSSKRRSSGKRRKTSRMLPYITGYGAYHVVGAHVNPRLDYKRRSLKYTSRPTPVIYRPKPNTLVMAESNNKDNVADLKSSSLWPLSLGFWWMDRKIPTSGVHDDFISGAKAGVGGMLNDPLYQTILSVAGTAGIGTAIGSLMGGVAGGAASVPRVINSGKPRNTLSFSDSWGRSSSSGSYTNITPKNDYYFGGRTPFKNDPKLVVNTRQQPDFFGVPKNWAESPMTPTFNIPRSMQTTPVGGKFVRGSPWSNSVDYDFPAGMNPYQTNTAAWHQWQRDLANRLHPIPGDRAHVTDMNTVYRALKGDWTRNPTPFDRAQARFSESMVSIRKNLFGTPQPLPPNRRNLVEMLPYQPWDKDVKDAWIWGTHGELPKGFKWDI